MLFDDCPVVVTYDRVARLEISSITAICGNIAGLPRVGAKAVKPIGVRPVVNHIINSPSEEFCNLGHIPPLGT